jgi:NAD:arginine ADP-ribosyltransferase
VPALGAQPHGGAPSAYSPNASAHDHHGPVDHVPTAPWTSQDQSALADYTGPGHDDLNDALRTNIVDASQHARVEALNQALEKLPPYRGPVFRGADLPPDLLARYQPDAVVTERAFLSTSTEPGVAQGQAFAGNVEFRIFSRTGRDISSFSIFPSEHEVLFANGTQFYVVARELDPHSGKTIVEMIEQ